MTRPGAKGPESCVILNEVKDLAAKGRILRLQRKDSSAKGPQNDKAVLRLCFPKQKASRPARFFYQSMIPYCRSSSTRSLPRRRESAALLLRDWPFLP